MNIQHLVEENLFKESHPRWFNFFDANDKAAIENAAREKLPDDYDYELSWSEPSYAHRGNEYIYVNRMLKVGNSALLDIFVKGLNEPTQTLEFISTNDSRMKDAANAAMVKADEIFKSKIKKD